MSIKSKIQNKVKEYLPSQTDDRLTFKEKIAKDQLQVQAKDNPTIAAEIIDQNVVENEILALESTLSYFMALNPEQQKTTCALPEGITYKVTSPRNLEEIVHVSKKLYNQLTTEELQAYIDPHGNSFLHLALLEHENELAEEYLLNHPKPYSEINKLNHDKKPPIHMANIANNLQGIKLALEFAAEEAYQSAEFNCTAIYYKVKGLKPYMLKKIFSHYFKGQDENNIAIIFAAPDDMDIGKGITDFLEKNKLSYIQIGDFKSSLSNEIIKNELLKYNFTNKAITAIVQSHGHLLGGDDNYDGTQDHLLGFGNSAYNILTKDFFTMLHEVFIQQKLDIFFMACHGGAAIKDVDLLPLGSRLITLAEGYSVVDGDAPTYFDNLKFVPENKLSLSEMLLINYLYNLKNFNSLPIIGISGKKSIIFSDIVKPFLGQTVTEAQNTFLGNKFSNLFEDYGQDSSIEQALNALQYAVSLEDLKYSESLHDLQTEFIYRKFFTIDNSLDINSIYHSTKCGAFTEVFTKSFLQNAVIYNNFGICINIDEEEDINNDILQQLKKECTNFTEEPLWSKSLAISYLLSQYNNLTYDFD